MSKQKLEYGIFEGDELLAKGSSDWIKGLSGVYVHQYAYNGKLWKHKYRIKKLGVFTENKILSDKLEVVDNHKELAKNAVLMMRMHGNTFADTPDIYRKELNDAGIFYTYRPCTDNHGYILEVIK